MSTLYLLPDNEVALRLGRLCRHFAAADIDMALIGDNATKYYLTGRVFAGWLTIDSSRASIDAWIRRPIGIDGADVHYVRKIEDVVIPHNVRTLGLEYTLMPVSTYQRVLAMLAGRVALADCSGALRSARAVKTPMELSLVRESGRLHTQVYCAIPAMYRPGMTDIGLQIELERALRLAGCLGQFRIAGDSMELFMGNIIAGDNADTPSPYDFAMGGGGTHASLPVGADGTVISNGMSVMVDANGNFTGYMTDMTRTFSVGNLSAQARAAHQCSIDICRAISETARPGVKASDLYNLALDMATAAGLADYFMGHNQKAGFVGHGVGIEINEAPVIAPRSRDIIEEGNVIAIEPKFVIPGVGALGIENTYIISNQSAECVTLAPEELLPL